MSYTISNRAVYYLFECESDETGYWNANWCSVYKTAIDLFNSRVTILTRSVLLVDMLTFTVVASNHKRAYKQGYISRKDIITPGTKLKIYKSQKGPRRYCFDW